MLLAIVFKVKAEMDTCILNLENPNQLPVYDCPFGAICTTSSDGLTGYATFQNLKIVDRGNIIKHVSHINEN